MQKRLIGDVVDLSILAVSASLGYMAAKSRLGKRKSWEPSDWSKLHLPFPGFFGLLRNLRPAKRAGPDLDELFVQLGCNRCFGIDGVICLWRDSNKLRRETDQTSMQPLLRK